MTGGAHDEGLAALTALMRAHAERSVPPATDRAGKLALLRRIRLEAEHPPRSLRPLLVLSGAVAVAMAITFGVGHLRPLSYEVLGGRSDGAYISAPAARPVTVRFADGSTIEAAAGARLRVDEQRVAGARVLVERGRAAVQVQHRTGSAWNFVAGPFDVRVTGTRFELAWDPSGEVVELELHEGSVEVRGPLAEAPLVVRAGQRFRADLGTRSMTVGDRVQGANAASLKPEPPNANQPSAASREGATETTPSAPASATEATSARPSSSAAPSEPWPSLVARGQFETVVAKAGERGTSECEATCSASELRAVADAARYTGRSAMAEGALRALRSRFGASKEGRAAAFLLGRLDEARGSMTTAERWYDTYLRELPGGDLAAEALAGKMRAVLATSGKRAAEPVAEKYLSLYPNGVHAQTARGIVASRP